MGRGGHGAGAALTSGLAGAVTLTAIHQAARGLIDDPPRMDVLGRRALARGLESAGVAPPEGEALQAWALAGDLAANTAYYALVGAGPVRRPMLRGAVLGAAAGLGAVVLPPLLGLGRRPRGVTARTQALTVAWYLAGGLAAGAAYHLLGPRPDTQAR